MNTKTTVIYHSADFDGLFCREIARKFLPEAELIGWDFGDAPMAVPKVGSVYVLDLPVDRVFGFTFSNRNEDMLGILNLFGDTNGIKEFNNRLVWIDHHKSSIESHPKDIPGYRIDGVAACRLAWQWFALHKMTPCPEEIGLPGKEEFVERRVVEPLAVRLAGEYDIWDKRDERADVLQFGLRSRELCAGDWAQLLSVGTKLSIDEVEALIAVGHEKHMLEADGTVPPATLWGLLNDGRIVQRYQQQQDASMVKHRSFFVAFEGLTFLALCTARCNSLTFAARDKPETGHDALMGFYYNGKEWTFSLYHAEHRKDLDLSQIAVKHGGGGHRGACGFSAAAVPFLG